MHHYILIVVGTLILLFGILSLVEGFHNKKKFKNTNTPDEGKADIELRYGYILSSSGLLMILIGIIIFFEKNEKK